MNSKVSIIVPFYNVSAYFERCILSLFHQTLNDIEYIFINDGSSDNSEQILRITLKEFPHKISQVKILNNTQNEGIIAARIRGIKIASSEYVLMIDADDYIDNEMVESLYGKALSEKADVVISDIYIEYGYKTELFTNLIDDDKTNNIKSLITNGTISASLCSKLFSKELLDLVAQKLPTSLNYGEDKLTFFYILFFANKVVKLNQAFYHYIQYNSSSVTKTISKIHFENIIDFWKYCENFIKEHLIYADYEDLIAQSKIHEKAQLMISTNSMSLREEYRDMFGDIDKAYIKHLKFGEKMMLFFVKFKLFYLSQCLRYILVLKNKKPVQI